MWQKFLSRKFLLAVGAIVVDVMVGLGYDVDPALVAAIAGGIAAFYILIEGIIDAKATGE